jgi:hypothetical protein
MARNTPRILGTLGTALLLGTAASGGLAAESKYDFTVCTTSKRVPLEANADLVAFGVENWGVVASSTTPMFEQATTHCVGYLRVMGGKVVGKGTCKWALVGGDTGVGEWEYTPAGEPTWTWLTGTGKLKGIAGRGTFREVFSAPVVDPAVSLGCRRDWGTVTLP